jgi:hypothetical protein
LKDKSDYCEIEEYIEVEEDVFFEKIKIMSEITVDKKWFYSNDSGNDKIKSALSFALDKGKTIDFNKGYFYALSRINQDVLKNIFTDS